MRQDAILSFVSSLDTRLVSLAEQTTQLRQQAEQALMQVQQMQEDLRRFKLRLMSTADTVAHRAVLPPPGA